MKKILITGANGFLGQHLCLFLKSQGFNVIATGKGETRLRDKTLFYAAADLTNKNNVENLLNNYKPDVVIHTAALSKPDECENNKAYCVEVNVNTTKYLVQSGNAHFVYLSTDFIFGENGPHGEDDAPHPLNFYGESKLQAETWIKQSGKPATIVRPVFMYGQIWSGMRPTFLHWVKNNLEHQKPIKVVSDQWRTPTYVQDICIGILAIVNKQATGVYNLAGKDILSPYEMAVHTAKVLNLDFSLVESVTADTFAEPVTRAKKSGLKIEKAIAELGYNPVSFEEGVKRTFEQNSLFAYKDRL